VKKREFRELAAERPILMDGSTGYLLMKCGMPDGVCPEAWTLEHPSIIKDIQSSYAASGSDIILAPTFGANRLKLGEYGLGAEVFELNRRLAALARHAVGSKLVAGDISMTGEYVRPIGDLDFEDAVDIFKEQIRGLVAGGVDLLFIETMTELNETRAALIAAKETCDLPVVCCLSFEEQGRTVTGVHPASALVTLQSLGADAVGCNCSTGLAKPNAGLPRISHQGKSEYTISPEEFASGCMELVRLGVRIVGGCCGTDASHISALAAALEAEGSIGMHYRSGTNGPSHRGIVCSARTLVDVREDRLQIIGERINPTRNRRLSESLGRGEMGVVREYAVEQEKQGADLLDVNIGALGSDESKVVDAVVEELAVREAPIAIDSPDPAVVRRALRRYPGRLLVNSISFESDKVDLLMDLCAEYGATFIALPIDDSGAVARNS